MAANGHAEGRANGTADHSPAHIKSLNDRLRKAKYMANFHEDELMFDARKATGLFARLRGTVDDMSRIFAVKNIPAISKAVAKALTGGGADKQSLAQIVSSLSKDSSLRAKFMENQVKDRYERMLHPPVTYLGEAFQYRSADGKFNSALHPHLGQAGAPYAKTVPSKCHQLGALPDAGDLFDRLMAREDGGRESKSGLSSMLLYHATIVIHDIFRTNDEDKNISDTSSYLDLSPLYGYSEEMQRKVRDDTYRLGLLKPDTFAEDRLLRQSPGVCIYLVMYNRYHNYCATQLRLINENGRFSVPKIYEGTRLAAAAKFFAPEKKQDPAFLGAIEQYESVWMAVKGDEKSEKLQKAGGELSKLFSAKTSAEYDAFNAAHDAAWAKLDDDLFNTARLITCGQFIQISIHDYLKALMGLHQFDTDFTLDPRVNMTEHKNVSRGLGNQVTVEFNLLYRFHCAISLRDEKYTEDYMREYFDKANDKSWDPKTMGLQEFLANMGAARKREENKNHGKRPEPCQQTFGLEKQPEFSFKRNPITGLFDDQQMINELTKAQAAPISNFGPRNVPKSLKAVEILGIMQARKWGIGTLNDFRDFFGMKRHNSFADITPNVEIQDALRDLYENVDKVELYPGVFCECDANLGGDPGPQNATSALWIAIFSDAITLVRSDRFYTVDWNTQSLTSWGMKEVTPDPEVLKGSVFHRLYQRAFPGWFPSDSILFFHPFYTPEANAKFAKAQGYAQDLRISEDANGINTLASLPTKPSKPLYLTKPTEIKAVLSDQSDKILHPVQLHLELLPTKIADVLRPGQKQASSEKFGVAIDAEALATYFVELGRAMILRNCITMDSKKGIYQIDVTKDFAIPLVARYVSEFLGIGHLVECEANPTAKYTENELYRHITNCQVYLSYNSDETKLLKRRNAFKASIKFLYDLALQGNVREANKWGITRFFGGLWPSSWKSNAMSELGFGVAQEILKEDSDVGRAAARMLIVALDSAYNSVLAFNSVLNSFIDGLYTDSQAGDWVRLQALALDDSHSGFHKIREAVLQAQRASVRLPIVRRAVGSLDFSVEGQKLQISRGDTIICDPYAIKGTASSEFDDIAYASSFTNKLSRYQSKEVAILSLASMIKVLAQMKNLRRGHDTQGKLKHIRIPSSYETYATFMAPGRMDQIQADVEHADEDLSDVFNTQVMKPTMDTYMTPEWDEMVPFPTTWKVRFEGFGASDYAKSKVLAAAQLPDSFPPFYHPKGPSSVGGTFGSEMSEHVHVPVVPSVTAGCSMGAPAKKPGNYVSTGV